MSVLVWDQVGDRQYETGLDRGVLYLPDGSGVPWNGLISIVESFDKEVNSIYYDGMKINDLVTLGEFSATMTAVTYPDEFLEFEGLAQANTGIYIGDQQPKPFSLSYRTRIGNDVDGDNAGYKLHVVYNLTAIPHDKSYLSVTGDFSMSEFEWGITSVPVEVPGFRPTAHVIINSLEIDPTALIALEQMLYGSSTSAASLISLNDLINYVYSLLLVRIVDNGDGTWTAIARDDSYISYLSTDLFQIVNVNATYLDADTYQISDT